MGYTMCIELGVEEPIVTAKDFIDDSSYPNDGILIFSEYMASSIKKLCKLEHQLTPSNKPYKIVFHGKELMLIYPFYGAPATTLALEMAIAYGLEKVVVVGEAGAIHPSLNIGEYVLPVWGIREEGVSYHYMPPDYTPRVRSEMHDILLNKLRGMGYRVHVGGVWSIDAIFRETRDKIIKYSNMNVLCVDMESTALMTVADYRGVDISILLVISDLLYGGRWIKGWGSEVLKRAEYNAVKIALETLLNYTK